MQKHGFQLSLHYFAALFAVAYAKQNSILILINQRCRLEPVLLFPFL